MNGESVNEALLAGVPVSPKTDFNSLSSSGFPFDCSMLNQDHIVGIVSIHVTLLDTMSHCWTQYTFSSFVSTLDLESRKVVPDVVPVTDSTSFENVLHIRDGLENLTLLYTLHSHL